MSDSTPGWQPDPTGKHDHRYWDGTQWTENISDAGVAGIDAYEVPSAAPEVPAAEEPAAEAPLGEVAPEPPATPEPEAPAVVDPTVATPVAADDTAAWPTAADAPAAWPAAPPAPGAPAPPPPYVPTQPVSSGSGGSKKGLLVGGGILAAVAIAVVAFLALSGGDDDDDGKDPIAASDSTDGSGEEGTYGSDPELDALYDQCKDGDFEVCDQLYNDSPTGSEYEEFADTCGGRNEPQGYCVDVYSEDGGDDGSTDLTDPGALPDNFEQILSDTYRDTFDLSEDQADCLANELASAIQEGDITESEAMTQFMDYLATCDISPAELSNN